LSANDPVIIEPLTDQVNTSICPGVSKIIEGIEESLFSRRERIFF